MIVLCTIPHTGTQFFKGLLKQHFDPSERKLPSDGFVVCHTTSEALTWIEDNRKDITLITTIRDWWAIQNSWMMRERDMNEYADYVSNWLDLLQHDPFIVSVDSNRDQRLKRLEQHLGVKFKNDWTPVNKTEDA